MRKLLLPAVLLCAFAAQAQLVEVGSIQKVDLPSGLMVNTATLSPDGSFVVISDMASTALTKVDLASGATMVIAENGSSLDLKISADGSDVVYRQSTVDKNRMRHTALKTTNLKTGKTRELVKPTRHMGGFSINAAGTVSAVNNRKLSAKSLGNNKVQQDVVASINRGHLEVTIGDVTTTLDPQGRGSYLCPSISPDGSKVLYFIAGQGCYVCDLDGSNSKYVGYLQGPKWLDNNTVVGCRTADNGEYIVKSKLLVADLNGTIQQITDESIVAISPSPSADGKRIAFNDNFGRLYFINLR